MIRKLRVTVDGKAYDVTVEMDDESPVAVVGAPGAGAGGAGGAPASVASVSVAPPAPAAPVPASASAPAAGSEPGDIPSPLAGRVTAINVADGQEVKEGDHLLTLEAMKMNTFVIAPRSGKVKAVKVAVGSAVEEGQALVTLG